MKRKVWLRVEKLWVSNIRVKCPICGALCHIPALKAWKRKEQYCQHLTLIGGDYLLFEEKRPGEA